MEIEHEYKDQSNISESQPHSPDEKHCQYCRTAIEIQALVCPHCRYHQRWWLNYFQQFGFVVSIAVLWVSIWPCSTEAATRPNKEHHDAREFPF
jgi:predicted nucleic acid-binding Zn ribbon protein